LKRAPFAMHPKLWSRLSRKDNGGPAVYPWNITRASELLGYKSSMTMLNKMDKYGVPRSYGDISQTPNS